MSKSSTSSSRKLIIKIVVNAKERAAIKKRATEAGLSLSSYTRMMALGEPNWKKFTTYETLK